MQLKEKLHFIPTMVKLIDIISQLYLINGLSVSDIAENPVRSFDFDVLTMPYLTIINTTR